MPHSSLRSTKYFSEKTLLLVVMILIGVGIIDSVYLLRLSIDTGSVCPVGGCDEVLSSPYAKIFGIPVALIGLLGFVLVFAFAALRFFYPTEKTEKSIEMILIFSIAGVAYGIYLTYLELFKIHAICPFCVIGFVMMICVLIITAIFLWGLRKDGTPPAEGEDDAEDTDEG